MSRVRRIMTVATVIAAGVLVGGGVAHAAPHRAATPGSYQSWGVNYVYDDGWVGAGKGAFGERVDATAVGGTQWIIDFEPTNGKKMYVSATYYFYGPGPTSTTCGASGGSCWYVKDGDRFADWGDDTWHSQYGSTGLVGDADRARGYYKACEDISFHSDPCSSTSILTTSY